MPRRRPSRTRLPRVSAAAAAPRRAREVADEIGQTRPFRSRAEELVIALLRTASVVSRRSNRVIASFGLSGAQYNVLRILRGAGPDGLPTNTIRERMIEEGTTMTRLVDKLERAGYVLRARTSRDRREVHVTITDAGLTVLRSIDPELDRANEAAVTNIDDAARTQLLALLGDVRVSDAEYR
jgi:DNA-binding MarR family transcriptional regulator